MWMASEWKKKELLKKCNYFLKAFGWKRIIYSLSGANNTHQFEKYFVNKYWLQKHPMQISGSEGFFSVPDFFGTTTK